MAMRDVIIAISILLILSVLVSFYTPVGYEVSIEAEKQNGDKAEGDGEEAKTGGGSDGIVPPTPKPPEKTNTELAYEVIKGEWGNGYTRKRLMSEANHDYKAVQEIVNNIILRGGTV